MLTMSDTNIEQFLPVFAKTSTSVAFLVPTPTDFDCEGYSIKFGAALNLNRQ